ncbi:MAG TPA: EAL domain-containing protein [Pyrinomonadaceae bacterium]|nr:EAL domain-containing protein [Pyrinomonadaceae bacterium]
MPEKEVNRQNVLIIDDETHIRKILCEALGDDYNCQAASSAEEGLQILRAKEFDLVISDINMPGISGLEMVPQILALNPDTVVIMMSGAHTIDTAIDALRVGAFDYLTKPFDLRHVEAAVRRALDHHDLRLAKRKYESQLEEKVRERTAELLKTTKALQEQITERNKAEEQLNYLAYHDVLTTLPNRSLFKDRLAQALLVAERDRQMLAVLLLSLDQFKNISDTLGPAMADQLICDVAERLKSGIREGDTLAYRGGDEFVLLLTQVTGADDAVEIARRTQLILEPRIDLDGHQVHLTASIGIGLSPVDGIDDESLMKNTGAALFQAKEHGGNTYRFYTADMNAKALKRLTLENKLRRAIERNEFIVYYQPKVDINTWQIVGAEALVRWKDPELGLISPGEFIPLAEETGLIVPIGNWVSKTACSQIKQWHSEGFNCLGISVNLCARQFQEQDLVSTVIEILEQSELEPKYLELEITESSIMTNTDFAVKVLTELKQMGIRVSVDDFGTGFSSLGYLKRLPIDILKIDQSFVRDVSTDPDDAALVMAIITLAHNLRLRVIAEGVETEEQLRFLRLLRCDEIQGYFFSKPLPADEFRELLIREQNGSFERPQLVSAA